MKWLPTNPHAPVTNTLDFNGDSYSSSFIKVLQFLFASHVVQKANSPERFHSTATMDRGQITPTQLNQLIQLLRCIQNGKPHY